MTESNDSCHVETFDPACEHQELFGRRAGLLRRVLYFVVAIFATYILAIFVVMPGVTAAKIAALVALAIISIAAFASRFDRFYEASAITLVTTIILGGFFASLTNGGLQGYVTPILLTAPIAAAVFLQKRAAHIAATAVILAYGAQFILELNNLVSDTPYSASAIQIGAFVMMATTTAICAAAVGFFVRDADRIIALLLASQRDLLAAKNAAETQRSLAEDRRKQAEAAAEAETAFLSNMSHEMRTPLNGILGMLQVMKTTQLDEKQRRQLAIMRSSGEALLALINDVLDMAKLDAGQVRLECEPVEIDEILASVESTVHASVLKKDLRFEMDVDLSPHAPLWGDARALRQVLTNLVGNAVKFTETGAVKISVTELSPGGVRFAVIDTGPGVPKDKQADIFSRFKQADNSTTREIGGTGLGLAICKRFVEQMGGEIGTYNNPQGGATFWFTAPLTEPREKPGVVQPAQAGAA